jgi:hypothetical protein
VPSVPAEDAPTAVAPDAPEPGVPRVDMDLLFEGTCQARTRRLLGSKASRMPSPMRLMASTIKMSAMPGK